MEESTFVPSTPSPLKRSRCPPRAIPPLPSKIRFPDRRPASLDAVQLSPKFDESTSCSRPTFHTSWKKWASISISCGLVLYICWVGGEDASMTRGGSSRRSRAAAASFKKTRMVRMETYDDDDFEEGVDDDALLDDDDDDDGVLGYVSSATIDLLDPEFDEVEEREVENDDAIDNQDGADDGEDDGDDMGPRPYFLVYASDESSRVGVEASIRSVKAHASGPVEFLYVGEQPLQGMSSDTRIHYRKLSTVAKKYDLSAFINDRFERQSKQSGLNTNPANYVRFIMGDLLPKQKKAMWVDADTIMECDVVQLFKSTLVDTNSTHIIAAVPREGTPIGLTRRGRKYAASITTTFNAGMYIVDLNRWRDQHMTEMMKRIANVNRKYGLYMKGSQPPLALVIGENFEHLPQSWNVKMAGMDAPPKPADQDWICLMHWSGANKPWNPGHEDRIHPEYWLTWGNPVEPDDLNERRGRKGKRKIKAS